MIGPEIFSRPPPPHQKLKSIEKNENRWNNLLWGSKWCSGYSQHCASLSPGSIPGPGTVHVFVFQSILASAGFSPGSLVFLLHLTLGFLNKYIWGIIWS